MVIGNAIVKENQIFMELSIKLNQCHSERSEESQASVIIEILHYASLSLRDALRCVQDAKNPINGLFLKKEKG